MSSAQTRVRITGKIIKLIFGLSLVKAIFPQLIRAARSYRKNIKLLMQNNLLNRLNNSRKEIERAFRRKGILLTYLFGSGAKQGGEPGPLSDLDFAVYFENSCTSEKNELYLEILSDLIAILGDNIELIIMNDASILMKFNIIKSGEVLFKRSENDKINLESKVIQKYLDTEYYRKRQAEKKISRFAVRGLK